MTVLNQLGNFLQVAHSRTDPADSRRRLCRGLVGSDSHSDADVPALAIQSQVFRGSNFVW